MPNYRKGHKQHNWGIGKDAPERCRLCGVARKMLPKEAIGYLYAPANSQDYKPGPAPACIVRTKTISNFYNCPSKRKVLP